MIASLRWTQLAVAVALFAGRVSNAADDSVRHVLTDSARNLNVDEFELTSAKANVGDGKGPAWSVRKVELDGGKQGDVELVVIDNGALKITLIPTRGMSILDVTHGDMRIGWQSPVKEVVHPKHIDLEGRGGLGWLEGFNEMMCRCGLEFAGHPGKDEFTDNTGGKAELTLTLHGKIGNIPASTVEVLVDKAAPHRIRVRGAVYERAFYGPKLKLMTELSTVPGEASFRIEDTVTNEGAGPQEFQLIYHANYGAPLLEAGAKVYLAAESVAPMNAHAGKSLAKYADYLGPTNGFIEEVYLAKPKADKDGKTRALLKNAAGSKGIAMSWSVKELPFLTLWKNTAAVADGYVTGIEPATGYPYNRKVEREAGRVPKLQPNETRSFRLDFDLLASPDAVKAQQTALEQLQGPTPAKLLETLP